MPRTKTAHCKSRLDSSTAVAMSACNRGWLSSRRDPLEQSHWAEDNGLPLHDEFILFIFTTFLEITDLVHCAATCRRWCRLVYNEAACICRTLQQRGLFGKFLPSLVVGFFQQHNGTMPHIVPTASASRRFPWLHDPSATLSMLVDGGLFNSCRIAGSRNGFLIIDLGRAKYSRELKLCICNPMTGEVHILPPLRGKDGLGHYTCTVLTATDYPNKKIKNKTPTSSYFCLVMVYNQREFTAFRSYLSEDRCWSPETKVTRFKFAKRGVGLTRNGIVSRGGMVAYWLSRDIVFGLHLDTQEATLASLPRSGEAEVIDRKNTLLGMTPEGKLCAIQICWPLGQWAKVTEIRVFTYGDHDSSGDGMLQLELGPSLWEMRNKIQIENLLPHAPDPTRVKLEWFCEKSGVIFFTAAEYGDQRRNMYSLSLSTQMVQTVGSIDEDGSLCGYEIDHVTYLKSLAL